MPAASLSAGLGIASGEDDGSSGSALGEVAYRLLRALGPEEDDADVGRLRQRSHVRIAGQSGDPVDPRIDRVDGAAEAVLQQVGDWPARGLAGVGRSTDDRHAAWMQETADGIGGLHGVLHGFHVFDFCRKAAIDAWCSAVV